MHKMLSLRNLLRIVLVCSALLPIPTFSKEGSLQDKGHEDRIFLTSELLALADGKSFGIHAEYIGFMLQIVREINKMLEGERGAQGKLQGIFMINGDACSIHELQKMEAELEIALSKKNKSDAFQAKKAAVKQCLDQAIKFFAAKVLPFNDHARGVQKLIIALTEESCSKRNRGDSFLLTWGECPEGKEVEMLTKQMTSVKQFDQFLTDLVNFLKDIIYSCPKARADFLVLVKQKMENNDEHHEQSASKHQ